MEGAPRYERGEIYCIPIEQLRPSQPDDGVRMILRERPVEVCLDRGEFVVVNGNHRYYDALERGDETLTCEIVGNPWLEW